jgi:hypothetical protein
MGEALMRMFHNQGYPGRIKKIRLPPEASLSSPTANSYWCLFTQEYTRIRKESWHARLWSLIVASIWVVGPWPATLHNGRPVVATARAKRRRLVVMGAGFGLAAWESSASDVDDRGHQRGKSSPRSPFFCLHNDLPPSKATGRNGCRVLPRCLGVPGPVTLTIVVTNVASPPPRSWFLCLHNDLTPSNLPTGNHSNCVQRRDPDPPSLTGVNECVGVQVWIIADAGTALRLCTVCERRSLWWESSCVGAVRSGCPAGVLPNTFALVTGSQQRWPKSACPGGRTSSLVGIGWPPTPCSS